MKRKVYYRCSTDGQDFLQQENCVKQYFYRTGIDYNSVDSITTEKVSGTVKHTERKLSDLVASCEAGDYIYISELSCLGRNMSDLFALVGETTSKGIVIIQCKDGTQIENESIGGKALLFALSLAAEIEVNNIRQRTQMGLAARKAKLKKDGEWVSNTGNVCKHFGREKGCDLSKAIAASIISRQEASRVWKQTSIGYQAVVRWIREGQNTDFILREFNAMHAVKPEDFSTPAGKPLTLSTLKQWRVEIKKSILR